MAEYTLGYYGKLPLSFEFIRYNAAGIEIEELDQWLREGMQYSKSQLSASWSADFSQSDTWNFLYVPRVGSRFVCGVWMPSRDKAGREFPFLVYVLTPSSSFPGSKWFSPLEFGAFFVQSRQALKDIERESDVNIVRQRLGALTTPVLGDTLSAERFYREKIQRTTAREFWTEMVGDFDHPKKYCIDHSLSVSLAPLRHQPSQQLAWGLKFPLFRQTHEESYDLPFWSDFMSGLAGSRREPALLLWNRTPAKVEPCFLVGFGGPATRMMLFLVHPDREDEAWLDLSCDKAQEHQDLVAHLEPRRKELIDQPDLSLELLIRKTREQVG